MAAQSTLRPSTVDTFAAYIVGLRRRLRRTGRTTRLLATLLLTLSIIGIGYGGHKQWSERKKESARGRRLLRKNSGLRGKDGSRILYVQRGSGDVSKVVSLPLIPWTLLQL